VSAATNNTSSGALAQNIAGMCVEIQL
jgi:hypothetical protein